MSVCVTGSEGFIGSHVVEHLVREGFEVRALVNYNSFGSTGWLSDLPADVLAHCEVVFGDVRDGDGLRNVFEGCSDIIHLAALISIPHSYSHPGSYIQTNVIGTLNALEAARAAGVRRFVQTSTSEVYGSATAVPMAENHRMKAQSPYAASKIGADQLALSFFSSFDLPVVIVRPFNTYGPRQSKRALIPKLILQFESNPHQIEVGSLFPTRDFTFATDTAKGFVAALRAESVLGEVINLGSGFEVSVKEILERLIEQYNFSGEIVQQHHLTRPRDSEVDRLYADTRKAKDLLDWTPAYSGKEGFFRGLADTIEWFAGRQEIGISSFV